jgi:phosphoglucomutase
MPINPRAGKPATPDMLVDIPKLVTAYYTGKPINKLISMH